MIRKLFKFIFTLILGAFLFYVFIVKNKIFGENVTKLICDVLDIIANTLANWWAKIVEWFTQIFNK